MIEKLLIFNDLVEKKFNKKHIVVINPKLKDINPNLPIVIDTSSWEISKYFYNYINKLQLQNISKENKILNLYEEISKKYIYDDNVLSYIKKIQNGIYILPEWYGKTIDQTWKDNRSLHNRRVCYEIAREFAASLSMLLNDNNDNIVCIMWNKEKVHYYIGLITKKYCITLDMDDYINIKDLTRVKTNLTLEGIKIIEENDSNLFSKALESRNNKKEKSSALLIDKIMKEKNIIPQNILDYLNKTLYILKEYYNLDSQGLFEYMKELVSLKLKSKPIKIWKKIIINNNTNYIRCLLFKISNNYYIIDVETSEIRRFKIIEFFTKNTNYYIYNLLTEEKEKYNGK